MRTGRLITATGLIFLLLTGCASTVKKSDGDTSGSESTMSAKDWSAFRGIWNDECRDEFHEGGAELLMQDGSPQPTG